MNSRKLGMVLLAYNLSYLEVELGELWSNASLGKIMRLYLKNKLKTKKNWGMV
jgi:hypothetical protein